MGALGPNRYSIALTDYKSDRLAAVIVTRYLIKEILSTFGGVMLVLFLMAVSAQLVGLFSKVAAGTLQVGTVAKLFGLYILTLVPVIVPLAVYLSVLLALTRLYRDSEMAALAACGFGPFQTMRAVVVVALLVAIFQGAFTLFFAPWADSQGKRTEAMSNKTMDIQGVTPGRFRMLPQGKGVIYVESINKDGTEIYHVFANAKLDNRGSLIVAKSGHMEIDADSGDRFLVLQQGFRYEGVPGQADFAIVQFERYGIRMQTQHNVKVIYRHRSIPSSVLLASSDPGYRSELQWRISSALLCIVLALLAVPLSRTSHRQGRYSKLAIAIVLYLVISNLLSVARTALNEGNIPFSIGLWWVHASVLLLAFALVYYQVGFKHLLLRRR